MAHVRWALLRTSMVGITWQQSRQWLDPSCLKISEATHAQRLLNPIKFKRNRILNINRLNRPTHLQKITKHLQIYVVDAARANVCLPMAH